MSLLVTNTCRWTCQTFCFGRAESLRLMHSVSDTSASCNGLAMRFCTLRVPISAQLLRFPYHQIQIPFSDDTFRACTAGEEIKAFSAKPPPLGVILVWR
jgi:hypothetical protein